MDVVADEKAANVTVGHTAGAEVDEPSAITAALDGRRRPEPSTLSLHLIRPVATISMALVVWTTIA